MNMNEIEDFLRKKAQLNKYILENNACILSWVKDEEYPALQRARELYCDNIPLSIYLLLNECVSGNCYLCSYLLASCFQDFDYELYMAEIMELKIFSSKDFLDDDIHCFLVVHIEDKQYVVDPSLKGKLIDKDFYFSMQKPDIKLILPKEQVLEKYSAALKHYCTDENELLKFLNDLERKLDDSELSSIIEREILYYKEVFNHNLKY